MNKHLRSISIAVVALALATGAQAKGSQAGGLPALAERVAALEAQLAALQGGGDFSGEYHVTVLETAVFACNDTSDPLALLGTPAFLQYFADQAIGSTVTRSATLTAESDGEFLYIPFYDEFVQELRLSGSYEEDSRQEGNISITIAGDGALFFAAEDSVTTSGYMSGSGESFTFLARGRFDEEGCDDAFTLLLVGNRILSD